jgi:xanthine/CO dehydrogenase XdhC/CoxF family maturation factor
VDPRLPHEFGDRIVCPLGEKIGNNTPPEIAVGIVSQLLRLRRASRDT